MATFWNSIDLQYREVTEPKIRPSLLGIVIPQVRTFNNSIKTELFEVFEVF